MNTIKNNIQVPVLDSLRAFAALSVCLYHFVCTTTGYIQNEWVLDLFSIGKCGVQLFFVISGFIIPWSMYHARYKIRNFFSFLIKRLARLEPPYLVSLLIAIAVLMGRERLLGFSPLLQSLSFTRIVLHFGYLIPFFEHYKWINQVYWTLAVEFQYYLFIALVFVPLISWGFGARIILYLLLLSGGLFVNASFLPYWLPVFLLGILLFLYKAKLIEKLEYYLVSAVAIGCGFYFYDLPQMSYILFSVIVILFFSQAEFRPGHFLGKMSYSLYLIHPLIGATLINLLSHHFTSPAGKLAVILSGLAITIIGSWIMYLVVEKPSKKLSSRLKY